MWLYTIFLYKGALRIGASQKHATSDLKIAVSWPAWLQFFNKYFLKLKR